MSTPARDEANRKNARKSTGPKTVEGKGRSRLNGLVHGLRSAEVVLPTESRDDFDAHLGRWVADWNPPTEARLLLVERAATAAWKLRRCTRVETERMARRSDEAARAWDRARAEAIEVALRTLPTPAHHDRSMNVLLGTRDGVAALIDLWDALGNALGARSWDDVERHHNDLLMLLGIVDDDHDEALAALSDRSWRLLLAGRPDLAGPDDEPLSPDEAERVRAALIDLCRMRGDDLSAHARRLRDPGPIRDAVGEEAAFTFGPQDLALQRYEGRLDREARALIAQLTRLEQTGADLLALDRSATESEAAIAPSEPNSPPVPEPPAPNEPNPVPAEAPIAPSEPNAIPLMTSSLPIVPDWDGRIGPLPTGVGTLDGSWIP